MEDDKMIPLSYVSQYNYCKRRAGLLMLEQQWSDSSDTVKGSIEHKNVHSKGAELRDGKYILTDFHIFSKSLCLTGKCDAIEAVPSTDGVCLMPDDHEKYTLYPIEYKHGKLREEKEYELQLCAQAMCLEEMYSTQIHKGAIFYISSHRRKEIIISDELRKTVADTAYALNIMLNEQQVPKSEYSAKCDKCSIKDICMPNIAASVDEYMKNFKKELKRRTI